MTMFLNLLGRWESAELSQEEAAELLGVRERTFRRWTRRYEEEGEAGLWTGGSARCQRRSKIASLSGAKMHQCS
jgi:transposase